MHNDSTRIALLMERMIHEKLAGRYLGDIIARMKLIASKWRWQNCGKSAVLTADHWLAAVYGWLAAVYQKYTIGTANFRHVTVGLWD